MALSTLLHQIDTTNNQMQHCESNPGFARQVEEVVATKGSPFLGTSMTIREMARHRGVTLTCEESRMLGSILSKAYRTFKENAIVPQVRDRYTDSKGKRQSCMVGNYPIELLSTFDSQCAAFGVKNNKHPLKWLLLIIADRNGLCVDRYYVPSSDLVPAVETIFSDNKYKNCTYTLEQIPDED